MNELKTLLSQAPVIPVLVIERLDGVQELAAALVKGGLPILEVTLRTDKALQAVSLMAQVEGAVVGVGTVLNASDMAASRKAGARFAVSPGFTDQVLDAATDQQLPLLPGASSATEVMQLLERGYDLLKFFPAEAAGGVAMLRSLGGPFGQVSFCPTGGVSLRNIQQYLSLPNVICVGGSWIATADRINKSDWAGITELAQQAVHIADHI